MAGDPFAKIIEDIYEAAAAAFSARLALERVRAAAEALGLLGLPAAVLGTGHRPLAANALFEGKRCLDPTFRRRG